MSPRRKTEMTTDQRYDLNSDRHLADLVAATTMTSPMPPERAEATAAMVTGQVRADTARAAHRVRAGRRLVLVAAPALAAAAVGALVLTTTATTPSPAPSATASTPVRTLSWSPVAQVLPSPAQPSASELAAQQWTTACTQLGGDLDVGPLLRSRAAAVSARATHRVLLEQRADSTLCIDLALGNGTPDQPTVAVGALTYPAPSGQQSQQQWDHRAITAPTGGNVSVIGGDPTDTPHQGDSTAAILYGMTGPQVRALSVVLASGQRVDASMNDGLWAAWWPLQHGQALGARLEVTTAAGQRTVQATTAREAPDQPTTTPDTDKLAASPAYDRCLARAGADSDKNTKAITGKVQACQALLDPTATQTDTDYANAVTAHIVTCLQQQGYPARLHEGAHGEMSDGAGRSQASFTVPGADPDDPAYRAAGEKCRVAAEAAVPRPPS